jgi:uncharacterized protein
VRKQFALAFLAVVAIGLTWWLLTPRERPRSQPIAVVTATLTPAPPSQKPTPTPTASAAPPSIRLSAPSASASPPPNGARLAIIVDDCGQWIDTERGFIALDIPLTLSVLPDVRYTSTVAREAADAGKGVMLHLPMETLSGLNPGPGKVTTEMTDAQIASQVEADLAQVPNAAGVNNHEGSKASADERVMRDVIGVLARHGDLFFIDSRTNPASVGEEVAQAQGIPSAARDVFLDNQESVDYTIAQLRQAAAIAKRNGSAIAIGHPRSTTLQALKIMIPELQSSGIEFVLAGDAVTTDPRQQSSAPPTALTRPAAPATPAPAASVRSERAPGNHPPPRG